MKKWIYRILMLICLGAFCYSAYQLWGIYNTQNTVKKETEELEQMVISEEQNILDPDWESLQAANPDLVGWIYIPGCDISYPVVQGSDNSYYLDHTAQGEYNRMGAIFLDSAANASFTDDNSVIYGHSVDIGGMFTSLAEFEDESFFNDHPVFYILTPSQNYVCHIAFFARTQDGSVYYTTSFGSYREQTVQEMLTSAQFTRDTDLMEGQLVTLSTCDLDYGFNSTQRLVVTARMEVTGEDIAISD